MNSPLHLVGRFDHLYTGAERELPDLARRLAGRRPVAIWSDVAPHPAYAAQGVRQIRPFAGVMPRGGMVLLGGVHVKPEVWLGHARPERVALRYNLAQHARLFELMVQIEDATGRPPELLFVSEALRQAVSLPGTLEPSLIDLAPFLSVPADRPVRDSLVVGRVSRDLPEKHHPGDAAVYRLLAAQGHRVRLLGGTCLAPQLAGVPGIELLPEGSVDVADFCAGLDVFFYRTGAFTEAYGRVVFEAMASGLPLVASAHGGFAASVPPGTGILVHTQEEAVDALTALAAQPELRRELGAAARAQALRLHGEAAIEAQLRFYLR